MRRLIFFDIETRSRIDVRKVGAAVYGEHPSTALLSLAWAIDDGPVSVWAPGQPIPEWCRRVPGDANLVAHNAAFEMSNWYGTIGLLLGFDQSIQLEAWVCTAARAAANGLPRSLEKAAVALGLTATKDTSGKKVMLKYCKPRALTQGDCREWHDDPTELAQIARYNAQDVIASRAIFRATPSVGDFERAVWLLDQYINQRGVPIDIPTVRQFVAKLREYEAELIREIPELTGGEVTSPRQIDKLLSWLHRHGANIGDLRADSVREQLRTADLLPNVRRVLEIREQLGRASAAKYESMIARTSRDRRARGCHLYYGAHTGRFAGAGIQLQNIPRGSVKATEIEPAIATITAEGVQGLAWAYDDPMSVAVSLIRPMIKAPAGEKLIVADFSQIEARVLAWLAGCETLLDLFRRGGDPYKDIASRIYGVPVAQIGKDSRERFVGKTAILGLGYGMGAEKFRDTCLSQRIEMSEQEAIDVVSIYRERYPEIPALWKQTERAALLAAQGQRGQSGPVSWKAVTYGPGRRWLYAVLPSGRSIRYYQPQIKQAETKFGPRPRLSYMGEDSQTKQWRRTDTYGGKLVENIDQGIARDVMVSAMLALDPEFPIVLDVHDEIVSCVPADMDTSPFANIMTTPPAWAVSLPVAAESFISERYRK